MKRIVLREYQASGPHSLSLKEIETLKRIAPSIRIEPSLQNSHEYILTPNSYVGVVRFGETVVDIRPKLPINRLFLLFSYAIDPAIWRQEHVEFGVDDSVLEAVAPIFCRLVASATHRGLLHGYRSLQEALPLVRGRIQFSEQIKRRYDIELPVEVEYDDFTEDITENQILLAALYRLSRLPIRSQIVRRGLREITSAFHAVSLKRMLANDLPRISFNRLNQHYKSAIELALLIIQWTSLEQGHAGATGTSFLIDMNEVFERFVHRALQEALHLPDSAFPRGQNTLRLDIDGRIKLIPDLSWWRGSKCIFVGDVKYRKVNPAGIMHHDLYQLLAYLTATGLQKGMLIYAAGEDRPARHEVINAGKTLIVETFNLAGPPNEILAQIEALAREIRGMN